jgi:hypothetical protein
VNLEEASKVKAGTKVMFDAQVWDFGYVEQTGKCILYIEGKCNMQDAIAVGPELVELKTVARERMARFAQENPDLPPGWEWHPWNGRQDMQIKWRALGPKIGSHRRVAYGKYKHLDTPQGCADAAWRTWEYLSGVTRADYERQVRADRWVSKFLADCKRRTSEDPEASVLCREQAMDIQDTVGGV